MAVKNKSFFILLILLLFTPCVNANVIFPHLILINIYSVFLFAIPIIFIEAFYYKKSYSDISVLFWLISTIVINVISSLAGIFIGVFSSFIIPNFIEYSNNLILISTQFAICCVLSWLIEYIVLLPITKIFKKQTNKLFKNVFFANLYSYIVIFVLYSIIFYIPYTHEKFFYGFSL